MSEADEEFLRTVLTESIAELSDAQRLLVVDLAAEQITEFELYRDDAGTPCGRGRRALRFSEPDQRSASGVVGATRVALSGTVILIRSSQAPGAEQAMKWLEEARPDAQLLTLPGVDVGRTVREVLANEPLRQPYDLILLREGAATGRLELACEPLFSIGARRGETVSVTVRCAPSDEHGTAFAVVTWGGQGPRPLSIDVAKLTPGRYRVTAELTRPGRVRLGGLPGLTRDKREWSAITALIPVGPVPSAGPAHLICAAETNGTDAVVGERLGRIRQVIAAATAELAERLQVSLVAYGVHSYDWAVPDEPVEVLSWLAPPASALQALTELESRPVTGEGYRHAAQVEDVLAEVMRRINRDGNPVGTGLLVLGGRPAHPARRHASEVLPCPHRHDWESNLRRLKAQGVRVGAICDRPRDAFWQELSDGLAADLNAVDVRRLGIDLGLTVPPNGRMPLPLLDAR